MGWGGIEYNIDELPAPLSVTVKLQLDWVTVIPVPEPLGLELTIVQLSTVVTSGRSRAHFGVEPVVGACNRHGSGGDLIAIGNAILHSAEVDRLGHIPVARVKVNVLVLG